MLPGHRPVDAFLRMAIEPLIANRADGGAMPVQFQLLGWIVGCHVFELAKGIVASFLTHRGHVRAKLPERHA